MIENQQVMCDQQLKSMISKGTTAFPNVSYVGYQKSIKRWLNFGRFLFVCFKNKKKRRQGNDPPLCFPVKISL